MKVLIVDDNPAVCEALSLLLSLHDIPSISCATPFCALEITQQESVGLVIQDMNFTEDTISGDEGKALFFQLRENHPDLPVILLTAWTHLEMAVELVRAGAADYLAKPWDDNKLVLTVKNLLELQELREENQRLQQNTRFTQAKLEQHDLCGLVFRHPSMERLLDMTVQVAKSDIPVLITGPNGAGKEKIADIIQANSSRKNAPFIKVNAGALPAELMEAELFGAEAGAYTGANKSREGRFEAANGGTLFLDEIGNLPLSGQIKLLRVLQTGEFERLGSNKTQKVDVRIISATNADLASDIESGAFREDLFYRLNVIELSLPALKDRPDDIIPLVDFFSDGRPLSSGAQNALLSHHWPGNIRELENAVKRASVLASEHTLEARDFGLPENKTAARHTPYEPSKEDIISALDSADGKIAPAAKSLGLSRQAFYRRLEKYGIER